MFVIAGLGNPGEKYERTRHNMGFMALDCLAEQLGTDISKAKFNALTEQCRVGSEKVLLLKPQTYMNESGLSVRAALDYFDVPSEHLVVIYDDMDLGVGDIRIRKKGGAGTHNGMRSIISHIDTQDFIRIRVGIGEKGDSDAVAHVLGKVSKDETPMILDAIDRAAKACQSVVIDGVDIAMNKYNGKV